jgi:hypothetical protein
MKDSRMVNLSRAQGYLRTSRTNLQREKETELVRLCNELIEGIEQRIREHRNLLSERSLRT